MLIKPPANIPFENTNVNTHPGVELSPKQKPSSAASSTPSPAVLRSKSSPSGLTAACSETYSTIAKGQRQYEGH